MRQLLGHLRYILILLVITFPSITYSVDQASSKLNGEIRDLLNTLFTDNANYVAELTHMDFVSFREQQSPRATVVACSDSRIQSSAIHKSPVNDLFIIRNMGNQIPTTEGTVEYGINHLHTPVLLIIGHSYCGAIITALGDYRKESSAIRKELDHLHLKHGMNINEGVVTNVNNQVNYALRKFKDKIKNHELVVVGTVYDFRDDFGHGHGRLILTNFNGETDPAKIRDHDLVKGFDHIPIGIKEKAPAP